MDQVYYPPRPLQDGERFDMIANTFLQPNELAAGTIAYRAAADLGTCDTCALPLLKGQEIAEDFVRGHLDCFLQLEEEELEDEAEKPGHYPRDHATQTGMYDHDDVN